MPKQRAQSARSSRPAVADDCCSAVSDTLNRPPVARSC
jgi:hypothetical protein